MVMVWLHIALGIPHDIIICLIKIGTCYLAKYYYQGFISLGDRRALVASQSILTVTRVYDSVIKIFCKITIMIFHTWSGFFFMLAAVKNKIGYGFILLFEPI